MRLLWSVNSASHFFGGLLRGVMLLVLKINLLAFFFWYAVEFALEAWPYGRVASLLVVLNAAAVLFSGLALIIKTAKDHWQIDIEDLPKPSTGPLMPYILLMLIPLAIVFVVSQWGPYTFKQPLSHATAYQAGRFLFWLLHS